MPRLAGVAVWLVIYLGSCGTAWAVDPNALAERASIAYADMPRMVLAFYYPWYGIAAGPGGAGQSVHWGRIDAQRKDIEASTHWPQLGAYDSHDPNTIDRHCRWAKAAGLDGLIVSWWGHGHYTDRAMPAILEACRRHGLKACAYYETVPPPRNAISAANDIVRLLDRYGDHPAHLAVGGKPVVFIYGRALEEIGLAGWLEASVEINRRHKGGAAFIGDRMSPMAARIFDGIHTYNTAGELNGKDPSAAERWASATYPKWVQIADKYSRISTLTVIPGYDDTKIRKPGLAVPRHDGRLYRVQWERAVAADPHWILITSFNEWHEGSEIEPSAEDGDTYLKLTAEFSKRLRGTPRAARPPATAPGRQERIPADQLAALRAKLAKQPIAVLPDADSQAFWWLAADVRAKLHGLTWDNVAAGKLSAKRHPILLYAAGERYRSKVKDKGDVDAALSRYLAEGGWLVAMPSLPWPFHYDDDGPTAQHGAQFGLTLRMGWEQPPAGAKLRFVQPDGRPLPHLPADMVFPDDGDVRWRPFFAAEGAKYKPLLTLRYADGRSLGEAVALAEPPTGGHILYVWFRLLEMPQAEWLLYDLFTLLASQGRL